LRELWIAKFPRRGVSLDPNDSYRERHDHCTAAFDREPVMTVRLMLANIERAGGHLIMFGILVVVALAGGLIYLVIARRKSPMQSPDENATDESRDSSERSNQS
jgi:hypothetical protein